VPSPHRISDITLEELDVVAAASCPRATRAENTSHRPLGEFPGETSNVVLDLLTAIRGEWVHREQVADKPVGPPIQV